ncbi:MAG: DUF2336 domain-containing protein [Proteobacteria bacterium]|nr:DUF2336 domain-containing protein [Pseudomonadota bacterium]
MILNILKKKNTQSDDVVEYSKAREELDPKNYKNKMKLAKLSSTPQEVLYYLADDPSSDIRASIAGNTNTPHQADKLLSNDENEEVKLELARKITRLFPQITPDEKNTICEKAIEMLEILANDQLPSVRQLLAEELKSSNSIPKNIAVKLANDEVFSVCAPILEYSPLLSDDDLKEVIAATNLTGALQAIAKRKELSGDICDAITNTLEIPAVTNLLANSNAQIREDTLDNIINEAKNRKIVEWHEPLTLRPNLSMRAMKRIASFVASALVNKMIVLNHLAPEQGDELLTNVRGRINEKDIDSDDQHTLAEQAQSLFEKGVIDDEFIQNAIKNKQRELVIQSLILLSGLPDKSVRKIILKKKGSLIVSLVWRAELSMRTALLVQSDLAYVAPNDFKNAKNGIDFPMLASEMDYEIALYE